MFWKKKPSVDEAKIVQAFQFLFAQTRNIWWELHSEYLSDKKVLADTAADEFIAFLMYSALSASKVADQDDAAEIWERCLSSFYISLIEMDGTSIQSELGSESFKACMSAATVTIWRLNDFRKQYKGKEFGLDALYESVYNAHNEPFEFPPEFKAAFTDRYMPVFDAALKRIDASIA